MSRGGKQTRKYKHDTKILNMLAKATGLQPYSIKRSALLLVKDMGAEFPTLTLKEWKRRYA